MLKKIGTRLKNKKVFMAVASGIILILVNIGVIDVAMSDQLNELLNTVLAIGVAVGIFSNPESHVPENNE